MITKYRQLFDDNGDPIDEKQALSQHMDQLRDDMDLQLRDAWMKQFVDAGWIDDEFITGSVHGVTEQNPPLMDPILQNIIDQYFTDHREWKQKYDEWFQKQIRSPWWIRIGQQLQQQFKIKTVNDEKTIRKEDLDDVDHSFFHTGQL